MEYQIYFNILAGIISVLAGWAMNIIWGSIKELQKSERLIVNKLNSVEVLVVGEYVRKPDMEKFAENISAKLDKLERIEVMMADNYVKSNEFNKVIERIFAKLDTIDDKLTNKADK